MQTRVEPERQPEFQHSVERDALEASRLRLAFDSIPALLHSAEPDGSLDYFNQRWLDYLGVGLDDIKGWRWISKVHPEDIDVFVEKWRYSLRIGKPLEAEARVRRNDGVYRWMLHRKVPLRDEHGKIIKWYGSSIDIDDRKRSEFYLAEGQRLSHAGSWSFKPDLTCDYWSRELYEILGFDPRNGIPTISDYFTRVHPEDRALVEATIQHMIAAGEGCDLKKRIIRPDGVQRVIRCVGMPVREKGVVIRFVGTLMDITEQEELTQELRRREAYLAEAQKVSHTGSWAWSPVSNAILYWSEECYRISGYDPAQDLPSFESSFQRIHPEDQPVLAETIERAVREKAEFQIEYRQVLPDGTRRNIRLLSHPVLDASGKLVEFIGTVMDVTEQKRAEEERRAHLWFLESMDRINRAMQRTNDVEGMMSGVLEETLAIFGCDRARLVYPCDPDAAEARVLMEHTRPEYPGAFALGEELRWDKKAAELLRRVLDGPGAMDLSLPPEIRERFSIQSILAIAVRPKGDTPYLFGLHQCSHARAWTAAECRLFEEIARRLEDALTSVLAHRNLLASEEELRRSQHYLAEAQKLSHTGSWSWSPHTDVRYWSEECYRVLGFDPGDGSPRTEELIQRIHPDDQRAFRESAKRATHTKLDEEVDYRILHPSGAVRDIHSIGHPVFSPTGDLIEFMGTVIDVTERKRAEEELRRREAYLAEAQRLSHTGSAGWNYGATSEMTWSEEMYRICGFDRSIKPTFQLVRERVHPDDLQVWDEAIARAAEGKEIDFENRLVMPDGTVKFVHAVAYGVQKGGKLVEFVATAMDITERKRAEETIRRSEAFLAEGQRLSHTGSWGWNASTGEVTWSQEHFRILGLDPQATNPSLDVFWERIHPDDRIGLQRAFESAIRDKRDFEQEFRIVTPDWSIRHLHGVGHAILNKANELVEFIGSTIDITERKRAEERAESQREAIRLALNAFVEELDVNRFLGDAIGELNKQFHANSWELWLFDEGINALLLHSSSHPSEYFSSAVGKNGRPLKELQGIWQIKGAARAPQILELFAQDSLLSRRHGESLKARGIKTAMIVPLVLGKQNLGFLELHFQLQTQFTADDLDLAQALVNHATLALQLNRLTRRAEQLAVTEERNRLARDIHDTLAQAFAGVVLHSEVLGASLPVSKRRSAKALAQIQKLARSGLEEARRSVQALRPKALDGNTLPEALRQAAIRLNDDAKLSCQFRQRGKKIHLSGEIQNELFRIGQEALTNVVKHAQAKSVYITLVSQARRVTLSIKDDGVGFAAANPQNQSHGFGMGTMRERAQGIGGRLRVESRPGRGTTIRVEVPSSANRSKRKVIL